MTKYVRVSMYQWTMGAGLFKTWGRQATNCQVWSMVSIGHAWWRTPATTLTQSDVFS